MLLKPPHVDRLVRKILDTDVPWVLLWGPPGHGKRAILRELQSRGATPLAHLDLAQMDRLILGQVEGRGIGLIEGQLSLENFARIEERTSALSLLVVTLPKPLPLASFPGLQLGPLDLVVTLDEAKAWKLDSIPHWRATGGWWRPLYLLTIGESEAAIQFLKDDLGPYYRGILDDLLSRTIGGKAPNLPLVEQWRELGWYGNGPGKQCPLPVFPRGWEVGYTEDLSESGEPTFQVSFFGQSLLRRSVGGEEVSLHWKLRRALAILAYLSLKGSASRDELMEMAWPGADPEEYLFRFHTTLSSLRRELTRGLELSSATKPVVLKDGWYSLSEDYSWVIDCQEFERLMERGERHLREGDAEPALLAFHCAIKLYSEPLLPEVSESWIETYREKFRELHSMALNHCAMLAQRLGQSEKALALYRRILQQEPWREDAHLALMRIYAGEGRRGDVHRQYVDLCDILSRELGQSPTEEISEEYHRLMR